MRKTSYSVFGILIMTLLASTACHLEAGSDEEFYVTSQSPNWMDLSARTLPLKPKFTVAFNKPFDTALVTADRFHVRRDGYEGDAKGVVSISGNTVTFTVMEELEPNSTYTFRADESAFQDLDGMPFEKYISPWDGKLVNCSGSCIVHHFNTVKTGGDTRAPFVFWSHPAANDKDVGFCKYLSFQMNEDVRAPGLTVEERFTQYVKLFELDESGRRVIEIPVYLNSGIPAYGFDTQVNFPTRIAFSPIWKYSGIAAKPFTSYEMVVQAGLLDYSGNQTAETSIVFRTSADPTAGCEDGLN